MRIECRRTTNGLGSGKLSPARYCSSSRRPEDDRTFFRGDTGIDGTRRGCNVGVALRHDHARVLRNVCQRPYGAIWHDSGTDGLSPSQESEIRDKEPKGVVSETGEDGEGPKAWTGVIPSKAQCWLC